MRKILVGLTGLTLAAAAVAFVPTASAQIAPTGTAGVDEPQLVSDDLPNPLESKRRELREQAITGVINGELQPVTRDGSTFVKVGRTNWFDQRGRHKHKDHYVELDREKTDQIFVILVEFGNEEHPSYKDGVDFDPTTPGPITWDGPVRNSIPEPDRSKDNSTVWRSDFSQSYFQNLYFGGGESLRDYYEKQSSGRYSVDGTVTNWVKVQYNEARYGRDVCGAHVCSNTWHLIRDAADQWYSDQIEAGRSAEDVAAELLSFDQWDRYGLDGDAEFNEPDGYLDHFQIVHAGGDQADGDPIFGEDAIWSHRWYAYSNYAEGDGPAGNELGGTQVGDSGLWIGDYTIQPENGGRSVFYHEFAHDLGLPDDYGSTNDNNNEHWTLMAQSRLGARHDGGIGERGGDLGAWNKLQLGWLDYKVVQPHTNKTVKLGPQEYNSSKPQAVVVPLPKKVVVDQVGGPFEGSGQFYSGDGDDLHNTLTRTVTLPSGSPSLSFQARYDIEDCGADIDGPIPCDYAYVEVDAGSGFAPIAGTIAKADEGNGIDGTTDGWVPATFDLTAFAGQTIGLRFSYVTDPAVAGNDDALPNGFFVDNVEITGEPVDGAENGLGDWTADGFVIAGSTISQEFDHYYIAGHRTYVQYDKYLATGPYFFGYVNTKPDFVDHYAYQTGLLISYWDTSQADNDTGAHPGEGLNLYIDSHPKPFLRKDGAYWRARIQVYDAPFGLRWNDSMVLHVNGEPNFIWGQPGQPLFDDTKKYWYEELPNHGVKLPAAGVKIKVLEVDGTSTKIKIY